MKLMKRIFFLFLAVTLLLACTAGTAESIQPMSSVDQEAFLTWIRNYEPGAEIKWAQWFYWASHLNYVDGGSFQAYLSEDASHVESVSVPWGDELNEGNLKYIRALCDAVGDTVSDETLQQVAGAKGADMGWQEMMELDGKVIGTSDGGKISFRAGDYGGNLYMDLSEEASAALTQEDLYNKIVLLRSDVLYVTLSRQGEISLDDGSYGAEFTLNCEGALHSITLKCKVESAEEAGAFFLDGLGLLLSGEALDAAKTAVSEQLPAVMADGSYYDLNLDSNTNLSLRSDSYYGTTMDVYCNVVPADAAGFINGFKLTRGENMRAND